MRPYEISQKGEGFLSSEGLLFSKRISYRLGVADEKISKHGRVALLYEFLFFALF
jgi:hypothetical protein